MSWTPKGDRILTQTADPADGYNSRIKVLAADGTHVRTIEPTTGIETLSPLVSPDGQRVAYADLALGDKWTIRVEPIDGLGESVETGAAFEGGAAIFRWSPDGELLIVTHQFHKETWLLTRSAALAAAPRGTILAPWPGSAWPPDEISLWRTTLRLGRTTPEPEG